MESVVVTNENDFIAQLEDGDILLFDKLGSVHRLVQWADDRPVGHCGIWCDGSLFEATIKPGEDVEAEKTTGVFRTSLPELLSHHVPDRSGGQVAVVRTVTTMRHKDITADARDCIRRYAADCAESAEFAVRDMVLLAPYALRRSYGREVSGAKDVFSGLVRFCQFMAPKTKAKLDAPQRMFCSEFVYRAYKAAQLPITVMEPLHDAYLASRRGSNRLTEGGDRLAPAFLPGSGITPNILGEEQQSDLDQLMAQYDELFETQILEPPIAKPTDTVGVDQAGEEEVTRGIDTPNERGVVEWMFQRRPPEFYEMVTPGDYWTSPSLDLISAFHRPPGH